jgi:hypothetical protein
MRGASAIWVPKRNARRVRKMGAQTKNQSTTKTLGAPTQRKARPEVGRPKATKGASARWAPKCNGRHVCNARHVGTSTNWASQRNTRHIRLEVDFLIRPHQVWVPQRNATHVRKMGAQTHHKGRPQVGHPNATQGTSASWAPQRTSATQMQGTSAHPQVGRRNATQGTSARWSPKRKTHPQGKRPHKGALG